MVPFKQIRLEHRNVANRMVVFREITLSFNYVAFNVILMQTYRRKAQENVIFEKSHVMSQRKSFVHQYQAENRICPLSTSVWQASV